MALYKEYDEKTLKKLQKLELSILKDFTELCERHGIDYFGCGGTAIGVMRHGGFIPWDDDIDVAMPRKDYERFLDVASREMTDKYEILNPETDPNYPFMTTRWILKGTDFREECLQYVPCRTGIFLDIFCFDNIADDEKAMRRQGWSAWFWGKLLILRSIPTPVLYFDGWKASLVQFACKIVHGFLRLFHVSNKFLYARAKKAAMRYADVDTKRVAYFYDPTPFTSIIDKKNIYPTVKKKYDGLEVRFPSRTEAYLEVRYGDYMTMPPEDKRHNHPPYRLNFGVYGEDE